jgi:hypothetical protein
MARELVGQLPTIGMTVRIEVRVIAASGQLP